ncbi:radical SAM protein [Sinorhizobium meliloti]|nr:radical SAM protein [Sinorhizobium meliloti]MDX0212033.1 radical SAM protein [Sinorhizobium meliloti]
MRMFPNLKPVLKTSVVLTDIYTRLSANFRSTDIYNGARLKGFREKHGETDVLLIAPPMADREGALIHPGIQILQTILRVRGISCEILNYNLPVARPAQPMEHLALAIETLGVRILGVSLYSQAIKSTMNQLARLKARYPHLVIVLGGPHPSEAVESLLGLSFIDYVIRGEAEESFPKLVEFLLAGQHRDGDIPGVFSRASNRGEHCGTPARFSDLDTLERVSCFTYRLRESELLQYRRFRGAHGLVGPRYWPISIVRGCPYACTFCAAKVMSGKKLRYRSVTSVVDELEVYRTQYNQRQFSVVDDAFMQDFGYVRAFCEAIIARNLDIEWTTDNGIRYESLGASRHLQRYLADNGISDVRALITLLFDAGWRGTSIGIESGVPRVRRDLVRKGGEQLSNVGIGECLQMLKRMANERAIDFYVNGYLMIGFPPLVLPNGRVVEGETAEEMRQTCDFAMELQRIGALDFINLSIVIPLPGTEMWDHLDIRQRMAILTATVSSDHPELPQIRQIVQEITDAFPDLQTTRYSDAAERAFWSRVHELSDDAQIEINGAYDAFNADAAYRIDMDRAEGGTLFSLRQALLEDFYSGFRKELRLIAHILRRSEGPRDFMVYFSYFCRTYLPNMKRIRTVERYVARGGA